MEENEVLYNFFVEKKPLVVPIPLHWFRQKKRGFNQSALLGKHIAQRWDLSLSEDLLVRGKYTFPQAELKKKERRGNIRGAFKINKKPPLNSLISQCPSILLIDDIWTTGATMREAGRVLKEARFKEVWGLALAR
jgi:ComF family protein